LPPRGRLGRSARGDPPDELRQRLHGAVQHGHRADLHRGPAAVAGRDLRHLGGRRAARARRTDVRGPRRGPDTRRGGEVMRTQRGAVALLAAKALLSAACGSSNDAGGEGGGLGGGGSASASKGGTIKIGLLSTLEGPFAPFGEAGNMGARVALLEAGGKLQGTGPRDVVT